MTTMISENSEIKETENTIADKKRIEKIMNWRIVAAAHEARLNIFDPTRRPVPDKKIKKIETSWGKIERLAPFGAGQGHADLLDAILFCSERKTFECNGRRLKLLVDPARVRKIANITSGQQFKDISFEIQSIVIGIAEPKEYWSIGHLIDNIAPAKKKDGTLLKRENPLKPGDERGLWRVDVGQTLLTLMGEDILRTYDPRPISRLDFGISQAVARLLLSHDGEEPNGGWTIDGLIQSVAGKLDQASMRNRRREIRIDGERLLEIGFRIENDRVHKVKIIDI